MSRNLSYGTENTTTYPLCHGCIEHLDALLQSLDSKVRTLTGDPDPESVLAWMDWQCVKRFRNVSSRTSIPIKLL